MKHSGTGQAYLQLTPPSGSSLTHSTAEYAPFVPEYSFWRSSGSAGASIIAPASVGVITRRNVDWNRHHVACPKSSRLVGGDVRCDELSKDSVRCWWSECVINRPYFLVLIDGLDLLSFVELVIISEYPRKPVKETTCNLLLFMEGMIYANALPKGLPPAGGFLRMVAHSAMPHRSVFGSLISGICLDSRLPFCLLELLSALPLLAVGEHGDHDVQERLLGRDIYVYKYSISKTILVTYSEP